VTAADVNTFEFCAGAPAFMAALRAETEGCTERLWVQFTTFEGDDSGTALANLLLDCARRGVDVRFLVDHYSDVIANDILPTSARHHRELRNERAHTAALLTRLRAGGVQVVRTAPVGRLRQYLMHRDHKKLVVIDGVTAFVGGLNISDHNFAWRDFMVRVTGPMVEAMTADFSCTWEGNASACALDRNEQSRDFVRTTAPGRDDIGDEVVALIRQAEHSVALESPSLLGREIEDALIAAARRGVQVRIVAPARHNRALFRMWAAATFRRLSHPRISIRRYAGTGGMTHAKLLVVDDRVATFGSFNFFELEALTQKELNVFTGEPALIAALRTFFDDGFRAGTTSRPPVFVFGRVTYEVAAALVRVWTRRLVRDPEWRSIYT
jgi:cardiolipin synthase A/B